MLIEGQEGIGKRFRCALLRGFTIGIEPMVSTLKLCRVHGYR